MTIDDWWKALGTKDDEATWNAMHDWLVDGGRDIHAEALRRCRQYVPLDHGSYQWEWWKASLRVEGQTKSKDALDGPIFRRVYHSPWRKLRGPSFVAFRSKEAAYHALHEAFVATLSQPSSGQRP